MRTSKKVTLRNIIALIIACIAALNIVLGISHSLSIDNLSDTAYSTACADPFSDDNIEIVNT